MCWTDGSINLIVVKYCSFCTCCLSHRQEVMVDPYWLANLWKTKTDVLTCGCFDRDNEWILCDCLFQCSQCLDSFLGTPTQGHQCYRQMNIDTGLCFDPVTQKNCSPASAQPSALFTNRTVFFAVQPKYLNVDIRIILDVTKGGLWHWLSLLYLRDDSSASLVPHFPCARVIFLYDPVSSYSVLSTIYNSKSARP